MSRSKQNKVNSVGFWGMLQNVTIAAMNKGQLLPTCLFIVTIILVSKLDSKSSFSLIKAVIHFYERWHITGWVLGSGSIVFWYTSNKRLRKTFTNEINRISNEKKSLQEKLNKRRHNSSNN